MSTPTRVSCRSWKGAWSLSARSLAPESPVALVYDGGTEAVMMASPMDLEDFALGFSSNEGIIRSRDEILGLETVATDKGVELRLTLAPERRARLIERRRLRAGPAGCGLCGVDSLGAAVLPLPQVTSTLVVSPKAVVDAMSALSAVQVHNRATSAMHAAGLYVPGRGIVAVREDVGRHNALDKLQGALLSAGIAACDGVLLMTSRVSVELVQKAAMMGAPILAAVSAPTDLAIVEARKAGVALAGVVRADGLEVFCGEARFGDAA